VRREVRFAVSSLRGRAIAGLVAWSLPEALPAAGSGLVVARAVDHGFLAGRVGVGLAWLGALVVMSVAGAAGSRMVFRRLGELAEPFRDDLVRRVVGGALRSAAAGEPDDGALARLTRQVEVCRDTYAGLLMALRGFLVTVIGVAVGLVSLAPVVAAVVLPPFLLGFGLFVATLGMAAARTRTAVLADGRLAATANTVLAGARDVTATGREDHAAGLVAGPIAAQATAERRLAGVAALRTLCFAVGGWLPLLLLLVTGRWLVDGGLTAGALLGGLTYVLFGLQPALQNVVSGLGGSGLRFVVTLGRILDTSERAPERPRSPRRPRGHTVELRGVTFAYGPHAEPVLRDLDLTVEPGRHLAVVGPSGIGKSTLVGLLCGLLRPDAGTVRLGGVPAADLPPGSCTVLIPQEAYIFAGTVVENLTYLRPDATANTLDAAVAAVGAGELLARLGGYGAAVRPTELSAGERQQVALVRAYLSPAPVAVLDEATCHLDPPAERRAEAAFAARGTLIVVAHRVSSALRAGRVLVLDGAGAVEGDHDTLVAISPLYHDLVGHWQPERVSLQRAL
jgi:ATP-binding cassette, subfamily C, bacterial